MKKSGLGMKHVTTRIGRSIGLTK